MRKKIETIILEGAEAQGIALYEGKAEILANYLLELLKINEKINLTAVRDPEEAAVKHIVDSLVVEKAFGIEDRRILDLGTGGGFPGVPLAVACGGREVVLLDYKGPSNHTNITTTGSYVCSGSTTSYDLFIVGVQVTSANCSDLSVISGVSGTVNYDPSTKTLTLDGATINPSITKTIIVSEIDGLTTQ